MPNVGRPHLSHLESFRTIILCSSLNMRLLEHIDRLFRQFLALHADHTTSQQRVTRVLGTDKIDQRHRFQRHHVQVHVYAAKLPERQYAQHVAVLFHQPSALFHDSGPHEFLDGRVVRVRLQVDAPKTDVGIGGHQNKRSRNVAVALQPMAQEQHIHDTVRVNSKKKFKKKQLLITTTISVFHDEIIIYNKFALLHVHGEYIERMVYIWYADLPRRYL